MRFVVVLVVLVGLVLAGIGISPTSEVVLSNNQLTDEATRLPQINISVQPDTSVSSPTIHKYLEITINSAIPGAAIYRMDRYTDATGTTLHTDSNFPKYFRYNPSMVKFMSGWGQTGVYYLKVSAWNETETTGGVRLSENSSLITVHFDHSYDSHKHDFDYEIQGPGEVVIKAITRDPVLDQQTEIYSWMRYVQKKVNDVPQWNAKGHPVFTYTGGGMRTIEPEYQICVGEPGVQYYALYGSYNGNYQNTVTPGLDTGTGGGAGPYRNGSFQPFAIVVPYENGTIPDRYPGYTGINITTPPIPGDHKICPFKKNITHINGAIFRARLNNQKPRVAELEIPHGWKIWENKDVNTGWVVENVSGSVTDGSLPSGFQRLRLNKTNYHATGWWWSYQEEYIGMNLEFPESWGGRSSDIRVRLYDDWDEFARTDNWETIRLNCENIPDNIRLPKRLHTGITWSGPSGFKRTGLDNKTAFFQGYKKMGFNSIPWVAFHYKHYPNDIDWSYTKENRTGPLWEGMTFGPEHSAFGRGYNDAYGLYTMLGSKGKNYIDTKNLLNYGVEPANYSHEREKWLNALDFRDNLSSDVLDVAYRGVWFNRSVQHVADWVRVYEPEYMFLDSESWASFGTWKKYVSKSVNAESRRLPGETDHELAMRMSDEFWRMLTENLTAACPETKIALYGCSGFYNHGYQSFKWETLEKYGVISNPSVYALMKHTEHFAYRMRLNREHIPKGWDMFPWLSSGTYGEHDPQLLLDTTAHTFANGATGINFFKPSDMDDHMDWLNMVYVIGYVSPYEDIIMDGNLSYMNFTSSTNAVTSGMGLDGKYFLAVSAKNTSLPVSFTFEVTNTSDHYNLYDLHNKKSYNYTPGGSISFNGMLPECGIFILQPYDPNLPPFLDTPFPADGAINVSLNTSLGISVGDNNTDQMDITWYSDAGGSWEEISATNSVSNGTYIISPGLFTSYNTTYNWAVNLTDGVFFINETFSFRTVASDVPFYTNATPGDGAVNISVNLTALTIDVFDPEGDLMDWSITTFPDIGSASGTNDTNGTKTCNISGLTYNGTYIWYLSLTDPIGSGILVSPQFTFTVEWEPVNDTPPPPPPPPPPPNKDPLNAINGPYFGYAGEPVEFSSAGSVDPDGRIVTFLWTFGDKSNSSDASPEHTYDAVGNYSVTLTITDNRSSTIVNSTYALIVRRNHPPDIPAISGPDRLDTGNASMFTFTTTDPDGDDIVYYIEWGDTSTAKSGQLASGESYQLGHAWSAPGNYTINVYAKDLFDGSASDNGTFDIEIFEVPQPPVDPPPDEDDDPDDDEPVVAVFAVILIAAVLLVIVIVAVVILVLLRKKKEPEPDDENQEDEEPEGEALPDPSDRDDALRSLQPAEEQGEYWEIPEEAVEDPTDEPNYFDESVKVDDDFLDTDDEWDFGGDDGIPDPRERDEDVIEDEPEDESNLLKDQFLEDLDDLELEEL